MAKYSDLDLGTIEAVVNKLGGMNGVQRFLRGELTVSELVRSWREEDGVIYFSVTSNAMTGSQWIEHLEKQGFRVSNESKFILNSSDFVPTNGVTTEIAVLKGMLWSDSNRITKNIRAEADKRSLIKPNAEVACLIREMFTDKELEVMGLWWIVAMHEPINDSGGNPLLLSAYRRGAGRWLFTFYVKPDDGWRRCGGFAFAVAQVSTQDSAAQS
ncbi:MAG: hypothetical protein UT50_C0009G0019 [Candidatus Moranbacteria bacterium GW2011_GWA2_39_41]|nr:MAG: hypothetical protein UT50_C0009G0019 [Candidatus Moranbacteria bacterium GW2011_GWA2_39_41]